MKIILSDSELKKVIYDSLCNALGTGWMSGYGIQFDAIKSNYKDYRFEGGCFEDVLMKILEKGKPLYFRDTEGDCDESFTLEQARERLQTESIASRIIESLEEVGDAETADCIIQTCLYGEVIFG